MAQRTHDSIRPHLRRIIGGLSLLVVASLQADESLAELDDAVARVHYAWYAGDERALAHAVDTVTRTEVTGEHVALQAYQIAVAYWRMADIKQSRAPAEARRAAEQCLRRARDAAAQAPQLTEARVVQAFCDDIAASARSSSKRRSCEEDASLQKAYSHAPENPRVSWALARCAEKAGEPAKALEHAGRAIKHFEDEALAGSTHSDWGHAETCVLLGRLMLAAGNRGVARDYVEQALVLTPDYVAAKELLQEIAGAR